MKSSLFARSAAAITTASLSLALALNTARARPQLSGQGSATAHSGDSAPSKQLEDEIKNKDDDELTQKIINKAIAESDMAKESGNLDDAQRISESLLKKLEKAYGSDHPYTAVGLINLARIYATNKSTDAAIEMLDKAALIYGKENDIGQANIQSEIATMLLLNGELEKARSRARDAMSIYKSLNTVKARASLALAMKTLANIYSASGQPAQAVEVLEEAKRVGEETNQAVAARIHYELSKAYLALGMPDKSRSNLRNAENGISGIEIALQEAQILSWERRYVESIAILEKLNRDDLVSKMGMAKAVVRRKLADTYALNKEYKPAIRLLKDSTAFINTVVGQNSPMAFSGLSALAQAYFLDGDYAASIQKQTQVTEALDKFFRLQFPYLSRSEQANLKKQYAGLIETSYQLSGAGQRGLKHALETAVRFKGIILDIERREQLLSRADHETSALIAKAKAMRGILSAETLSPAARAALLEQFNALEREIGRIRTEENAGFIGLDTILKAMPHNSALIEYIEYSPYDTKKKQRLDPIYMAIVANSDGSMHRIELGSKASLDKKIAEAINAISENQLDGSAMLTEVASLTLNPLMQYIRKSSTLIFAPDGELNRVPFTALPDPAFKNKLLSESKNLSVLTSSRDMIKDNWLHSSGKKSLVIVDPDYDWSNNSSGTASKISLLTSRRASPKTSFWAKLPATRSEGVAVSAILNATIVSGKDATKKVVLEIHRPTILHIATHGFFSSPTIGAQPKNMSPGRVSSQAQKAIIEDYLNRNGLVFAGANRSDQDDKLAYLSAKEAAGLDLIGTELVVLSACSTASGVTQSGEGLYGLQRALKVAGARTTLLSLWKVDDSATAKFMERFYSYIKSGESRRDALKLTQLEFQNGTLGGGKWSEPYYWAAWQLVGDWRPIKGL